MTREENIRAILECNFAGFKDDIIDIAVKRICELEQEPRKGEWQLTDDEMFVYCPFCHETEYERPIDASWKYCPDCGARMEEVRE